MRALLLCCVVMPCVEVSGQFSMSRQLIGMGGCMADTTGARFCQCPIGTALTGLTFNTASPMTLLSVREFQCSSLYNDPSNNALLDCKWVSTAAESDVEGVMGCDPGWAVAGLYHASTKTGHLDTLDRFRCCRIPIEPRTGYVRVEGPTMSDRWETCFSDAPTGTCELSGVFFLQGLSRRGTKDTCTGLDCINGAEYFGLLEYEETMAPTAIPSTAAPTSVPTAIPTAVPTSVPTSVPTAVPTSVPTSIPTSVPTAVPTAVPTSVPQTNTPPTGAPSMQMPLPTLTTVADPTASQTIPRTAVPDTAVPSTPAPATPVVTDVPDPATTPSLTAEPTNITSAPQPAQPTATAVLPDDVSTREPVPPTLPATDVPDTPVPPLKLPAPLAKKLEEQREVTESVSAGAAIASAAGVGGGAGSAMRLALVASECVVGDQRKLSWAFHPTGIRVGDNVYVGAIVGNMACVAGFALLASATLSLVNRFAPMRWVMRLAESTDSQGLLRFPSAPLFVFQWFYQSLSLCGFTLLISSEGGHLNMIGIATCGVCLGVPIYIVRVLVKGVPESATYAEDPEHSGLLYTIVCGAGEWVNTFRSRLWVQRYASIVRTWRQKAVYFAFIDLMASFFLSGISALETENWIGCGHVRTAQALVFFGLTCLEGRYWPHARWRDTMVDFVLLGGQCAALGLLAAAYYSGNADHAGFPTSQLLLMLVGYILVAKVVADILTELYIIMTGRRQRIQHLMWKPGRRHTITKSEGRHSFRDPEYAFETHRTSSTVAQSMPSSATTIEADEFTESLDTPVTKARKGSELLSAPPLYQNERQAPHPVERSCYGAPRSPLLATREDVSLL
eukprot:Rhum_TRINITY_DN15000_c1_g1::Rhum_TRINITY_DN15000_c1_g1_i6::g.133038::m.133038